MASRIGGEIFFKGVKKDWTDKALLLGNVEVFTDVTISKGDSDSKYFFGHSSHEQLGGKRKGEIFGEGFPVPIDNLYETCSKRDGGLGLEKKIIIKLTRKIIIIIGSKEFLTIYNLCKIHR